jgi:PAS domain S-box-containing protein
MIKGVEALVTGFSEGAASGAEPAAFRELLDALPAAVYTTDAAGTITFVNRAAIELAGRTPTVGEDQWCVTFRLYSPDGKLLPHDECPMAIALKEARPVRDVEIMAERPDGRRVPVMPFPTPLFDETGAMIGAVNVLVDISKLKTAEQAAARRADEQAALYRFTDRLYRAAGIEDAVDATLDTIESALSVRRASILLFDEEGLVRFVGWRGLSDAYRAAVEGHCPWKPGERDAQPIFVTDIDLTSEPDTIKQVVHAEGMRGLAFIPLTAHGGVIGKFMTYYETAHIFSDDERALAVTLARQLGFALERQRVESDRKRAEAQRDLLVAELSHRVKNTLATVVSIARQSFAKGPSIEEAQRSFDGRLRALAHTHGRLAESNWDGASLRSMLSDELAPYHSADGGNVTMHGPDVRLDPRRAVVLGMAFHELATNAAKYGALSSKDGRLAVRWNVQGAPRRLQLDWVEGNGPAVQPPQRSGFGRLLLERALTSDLQGQVELKFLPEGLRCSIAGVLDDASPSAA